MKTQAEEIVEDECSYIGDDWALAGDDVKGMGAQRRSISSEDLAGLTASFLANGGHVQELDIGDTSQELRLVKGKYSVVYEGANSGMRRGQPGYSLKHMQFCEATIRRWLKKPDCTVEAMAEATGLTISRVVGFLENSLNDEPGAKEILATEKGKNRYRGARP